MIKQIKVSLATFFVLFTINLLAACNSLCPEIYHATMDVMTEHYNSGGEK